MKEHRVMVGASNPFCNELHPYPPGFEHLAEKFLSALRHSFS